jgi:hypothetical protein
MLVFPQLSTGAAALYPVIKRVHSRSAENILDGGNRDIAADPDAAATAWELRACGLTRAEWDAIESVFQQASGRWGSFTFLDPTGNLLARSETLTDSIWVRGPLLQLTTGIVDPFGTMRATNVLNGGQTDAAITQTLSVPGDFQYCLSAWARSGAGSHVGLAVAGASIKFALGAQWRRIFVTANPQGAAAETVAFAIHLDAGASVEVFGIQVEAQPGPSEYKATGARGGVYPRARFHTDRLTVVAQGTDIYDAVIPIMSTEA